MNLFSRSYCERVEGKDAVTTSKFGATALVPAKAPVVSLCVVFALSVQISLHSEGR